MKPNKDFDIEFVGLKLGLHDFEYSIKNTFFQDIDFIDFNNIKLIVISLTKYLIKRLIIALIWL